MSWDGSVGQPKTRHAPANYSLTASMQIGTGISSAVDNIIALRHVEIESSLRRSAVIMKARGSAHDNEIREFEITPKGVVLKKKFLGMEQILGGTPRKSIQQKPLTDGSKPSRER